MIIDFQYMIKYECDYDYNHTCNHIQYRTHVWYPKKTAFLKRGILKMITVVFKLVRCKATITETGFKPKHS